MNRAEFVAGSLASVAAVAPVTPNVRIAVVLPQSGEDARFGREVLLGVRGGIDLLNEQRGGFDPVILYDVLDDRNTENDARLQASFAVGNPQIIAAIGHLGAAATIAALPTWANAQMSLVVPVVTDDRLTREGHRNVFRLVAKDGDEGRLLGRRAVDDGAKRVRAVMQNAAYGPEVSAGVMRGATGRGVDADTVTVPLDRVDWAQQARLIAATRAEAVVLTGNVADLGQLVPALRAAGWSGRLYASQGFFDARTTALGDAANGMIVSSDMPYWPLAPGAQTEVTEWQRRNGALTPPAAFGFAAVQVIAQAIRRSRSTSRAGIARAIGNLGPFSTVTGLYNFAPGGDPSDPDVYFYKVTGGKFVYDRQAHPSSFMLK